MPKMWDDIVGKKSLEDGGYVGDMLEVARKHIEDAKLKNQITQAQAGELYSTMIPAAFSNALTYAFK